MIGCVKVGKEQNWSLMDYDRVQPLKPLFLFTVDMHSMLKS